MRLYISSFISGAEVHLILWSHMNGECEWRLCLRKHFYILGSLTNYNHSIDREQVHIPALTLQLIRLTRCNEMKTPAQQFLCIRYMPQVLFSIFNKRKTLKCWGQNWPWQKAVSSLEMCLCFNLFFKLRYAFHSARIGMQIILLVFKTTHTGRLIGLKLLCCSDC